MDEANHEIQLLAMIGQGLQDIGWSNECSSYMAPPLHGQAVNQKVTEHGRFYITGSPTYGRQRVDLFFLLAAACPPFAAGLFSPVR